MNHDYFSMHTHSSYKPSVFIMSALQSSVKTNAKTMKSSPNFEAHLPLKLKEIEAYFILSIRWANVAEVQQSLGKHKHGLFFFPHDVLTVMYK